MTNKKKRLDDLHPYFRAVRAFIHGAPLSTNPYALGTKDHAQWDKGWYDTREKHLTGGDYVGPIKAA